jgi:DNA-directed RNA polymerase subunit M/transcription elongation factor TFIIS
MKETSSGRSAAADRDGNFDSDRETEHHASSNSHSTSIDEEVEQIALTTRRVNSSRNRAKEIRMQQRQQQSKEEETTENKQGVRCDFPVTLSCYTL